MHKDTQNNTTPRASGSRRPVWQLLCADLLLAAVILLLFAYLQHGRAYLRGETVARLSTIETLPTAQPVFPSSHESDGDSLFTDGEPVQTENTYISSNVNVSWTRCEDDSTRHHVVYYVADVYLRSPEYLCTYLATGGYETMYSLASKNNAIIAINGDFSLARLQGPIVRQGVLMRDNSFGDVLVMYADGSMETFSAEEYDINAIADKGVSNVWSFGPSLLDKAGKALTEFTTTVASANPRTAIGYYEPCHYCFVVVDGRGNDDSYGMDMKTLSKLFEQLGCSVAYNMDGGQSSIMAWDLGSTVLNTPVFGGRDLGDIIYIPKV